MSTVLIGMSGIGKSHWSKELQNQGLERDCCDALIEEKLDEELKVLGYSGMQDMAKWMGQPYDKQYHETSKKYLDLEQEVLEEVLIKVERPHHPGFVIDTTGSVIYLGSGVLSRLSTVARVVYLETPETVKKEMFELYKADPKPVIWGSSFFKVNGETNMEALARCYPKLLAYRAGRYANLAHITLDYHQLRMPGFTIDDFVTLLSQ